MASKVEHPFIQPFEEPVPIPGCQPIRIKEIIIALPTPGHGGGVYPCRHMTNGTNQMARHQNPRWIRGNDIAIDDFIGNDNDRLSPKGGFFRQSTTAPMVAITRLICALHGDYGNIGYQGRHQNHRLIGVKGIFSHFQIIV